MKVLQIGKYYPPHKGGIETHLETLCASLKDVVTLDVVVVSDNGCSSREVIGGVPVTRLRPLLTAAGTAVCPELISHIRRSDADLIHVHMPNPWATIAYLVAGAPGRLVCTYHSDVVRQRILNRLFSPILHSTMRQAAAVIASSPNYIDSSPVLTRYRDICHVIPFGIRVPDFNPTDATLDTAAAIKRQYGSRLVMAVGRMVYYKGFDYLIRAMHHVNGNALLVGDGPLRAQLERLARECNVANRVHFLGSVSDFELKACYHAASVFVLPSIARSEAFAIVQAEAMAAGLPVINTQLPSGVPFVSLHGRTGITVPPADAAELSRAINLLLDNPLLRQQYAKAARSRAEEEFSLETMAARTVSLYETLVSSRQEKALAS